MHDSVNDLLDYNDINKVVYKEVNGKRLNLLFSLPKSDLKNDRTAIVWIHGGGMTSGSAADYIPHCIFFSERGKVGFSIEYRLLSEKVAIEDCLSDVADAIIYIRSHAKIFGIHPKRIVVVGESAGGYLALSLVTVIKDYNNGLSVPDAVVNCNGVVDLTGPFIYCVSDTPFTRPTVITEGLMEKAKRYSPIYNIRGTLPPLLSLQGEQDKIVLPEITKAFHKEYNKKSKYCRVIFWEDAKHAFIVTRYTATKKQIDRAIKEIESFITSISL